MATLQKVAWCRGHAKVRGSFCSDCLSLLQRFLLRAGSLWLSQQEHHELFRAEMAP